MRRAHPAISEPHQGKSVDSALMPGGVNPTTKPEEPASSRGRQSLRPWTDGEDHGLPSDDEDLQSLSQWVENMEINPLHPRQYAGNSSPFKLVKAATMASHKAHGGAAYSKRPEFWIFNPVIICTLVRLYIQLFITKIVGDRANGPLYSRYSPESLRIS
jgi:hypothetical protein